MGPSKEGKSRSCGKVNCNKNMVFFLFKFQDQTRNIEEQSTNREVFRDNCFGRCNRPIMSMILTVILSKYANFSIVQHMNQASMQNHSRSILKKHEFLSWYLQKAKAQTKQNKTYLKSQCSNSSLCF